MLQTFLCSFQGRPRHPPEKKTQKGLVGGRGAVVHNGVKRTITTYKILSPALTLRRNPVFLAKSTFCSKPVPNKVHLFFQNKIGTHRKKYFQDKMSTSQLEYYLVYKFTSNFRNVYSSKTARTYVANILKHSTQVLTLFGKILSTLLKASFLS